LQKLAENHDGREASTFLFTLGSHFKQAGDEGRLTWTVSFVHPGVNPHSRHEVRRVLIQPTLPLLQIYNTPLGQNFLDASDKLYLQNLLDLRDLRSLLLTRPLVEKVLKHLPHVNTPTAAPATLAECIDLLAIIVGRLLQIIDVREKGVEEEIQQFVNTFITLRASTTNNKLGEAALDVIRYLPTRNGNEIKCVLQVAEASSDTLLTSACAHAIRRAEPKNSQDLTMLVDYKGKEHAAKVVCDAIDKIVEDYKHLRK